MMELGAKLKLGFIDGSCPKPGIGDVELQRWIRCDYMVRMDKIDVELQRWIRCDYMVTCWILNLMVTEFSDAFLYAQSASELWKEIAERYRHNSRNVGMNFKTSMLYQLVIVEGHTVDQCFEKIGYPNWYKGKKAKKQRRIAASVSGAFDDHFSGDTPFDLGNENEIRVNQGEQYMASTSQQNGRVKRKHRHLLNTAKDLRLHANLPLKFWGDCILTATYLINKMHVKLLDWKSPYEKLDVVFEEIVFPFKQPITPSNDQFLPIGLVFETNPLEETVIPKTPLPATTHTPNFDFNEQAVENVAQHVVEPVQNDPLTFTSSSVPVRKSTRSSNRPAWLKDFVTPAKVNSTSSTPHYPLFASSEFKDIPSTHVAFLANMSLHHNETWTIASLPEGHKPITLKWVFKTKYKPNGTMERLKARLVVRGFNQQEGLDYKHTFSPVAKLVTVRVLIALATAKQWPLHQLDINNAFLHGYIDDEINILPHEGYNKASKGQVCKLSKSLSRGASGSKSVALLRTGNEDEVPCISVLEVLKKMFRREFKDHPRGTLQLNAMRMAEIFADDNNFKSFIVLNFTESLTRVFSQPCREFLCNWCSSERDPIEEDVHLEFDSVAAAGEILGVIPRQDVLKSTYSTSCARKTPYGHQKSSLLVKIIAHLTCSIPNMRPGEKGLLSNKFFQCLQMEHPNLPNGAARSSGERAVAAMKNLRSLLAHAGCLVPEYLRQEDVNIFSKIDNGHNKFISLTSENSFFMGKMNLEGYICLPMVRLHRLIFFENADNHSEGVVTEDHIENQCNGVTEPQQDASSMGIRNSFGVREIAEVDPQEEIVRSTHSGEKQQKIRKGGLMNDTQVAIIENTLKGELDMNWKAETLKLWADKLSSHGSEITSKQLSNWLCYRKVKLARAAAKDGDTASASHGK
nr:hypothetical protein [Tanacetum cinerariifolium]